MAKQSLSLILYSVFFRLRAEASKTYAGFLWWLLEPLLEMSVYFLLFGIILKRGGPDYIPFLFIGLLSWKWLVQVVIVSSNALISNQALIMNFSAPKYVYPLTDICVYTFRFFVIFIPTSLIIATIYGFSNLPYLIPALVSELLLISGAGVLICSIMPFLPDLIKVLPVSLRLLFYPSGIIFSIDIIKDLELKYWVSLNPLIAMFENIRFAVMSKGSFDWVNVLVISLIGATLLSLGLLNLNRNDKKYPRMGL